MRSVLGRRLKALEAKSDVDHKPITLAFFQGSMGANKSEIGAKRAKSELNGERLIAICFVSPKKTTGPILQR